MKMALAANGSAAAAKAAVSSLKAKRRLCRLKAIIGMAYSAISSIG